MSVKRYELGEKLGEGQMTVGVFRAKHRDLGTDVAIKLLELRHPDHRAWLLEECRRMAGITSNEYIVRVLDSGDWDDDYVFLAVELCDGGSLEELCADGPLDPQTACRYVSDACRGLQHLHLEGMLHLDIRPANILLSDDKPKLADFGLARPDGDAGMGTVYSPHVAPEVIATMKGSAHADQFSMAMTLGHLLSHGDFCAGPVPHPSDTKAWRQRPDLNTLALHVPDKLRRVLGKATRFDPQNRYESVEEFKRHIDRATPARAFMPGDDGSLVSTDGATIITRISKRTGCTVEVLINGRRRSADCRTGLTDEDADQHTRSLVTQHSYAL